MKLTASRAALGFYSCTVLLILSLAGDIARSLSYTVVAVVGLMAAHCAARRVLVQSVRESAAWMLFSAGSVLLAGHATASAIGLVAQVAPWWRPLHSSMEAATIILYTASLALVTKPSAPQLLRRVCDALMGALALTLLTWLIVHSFTGLHLGAAIVEQGQAVGLPAGVDAAIPALLVGVCFLGVAWAVTTLWQSHLKSRATVNMAVSLLILGPTALTFQGLSGVWQAGGGIVHPALLGASVWAAFVATRESTTTYPAKMRVAKMRQLFPSLFLVILLVFMAARLVNPGFDNDTMVAIAALMVLVAIVRQVVYSRENHYLMEALQAREKQLQHRALHDDVTGLENRLRFVTRVDRALHTTKQGAVHIAIVDLDVFGAVNETYGRAAGDRVLVEAASRLMDAFSGVESVARIEADEFAVVLAPYTDVDTAGEAMTQAMRRPFTVGNQVVRLTASVGLASVDAGRAASHVTSEDLLSRAERAMLAVKQSGRDGYRAHTGDIEQSKHSDRSLAPVLARAIDDGDIETVYQPIVATDTGRLIGFEALSRWQLDGEWVRPDIFIGAAERCGLIDRLTELVIDRACHQLAVWNEHSRNRRLSVAVNIGGYSLRSANLADAILRAVEKHRVEPGQLRLEITETVPITDIDSARGTFERLGRHGVKLSLDDFGTGYNSISQLLRLPVATVKIERSIMANITTDHSTFRVVQGMYELARHLGLSVIAEGVETAEQLALARHLGIQATQGFLVGKGEPADHWADEVLAGHVAWPSDVPPATRLPMQSHEAVSVLPTKPRRPVDDGTGTGRGKN